VARPDDLFRRLVPQGTHDLIDAEFTAPIGADRYERTDARTNYRNDTQGDSL